MNAAALEKENLHPALTILSDEEEQFRAAIREFAEGEVRPRVEEMEKEAHLDQDLIKQCFELGLMAIETPEEYGGAGSTF
ncbi:MAG: acyl-CoA dehydrogenase family protein, partial [Acidobacteriota bacterium]